MIAFHTLPPTEEPLDYDPNETDRKMEAVDLLVGTFVMKGQIRISTHTEVDTTLESACLLDVCLRCFHYQPLSASNACFASADGFGQSKPCLIWIGITHIRPRSQSAETEDVLSAFPVAPVYRSVDIGSVYIFCGRA